MGQFDPNSPPPPWGWRTTYERDFTTQGQGDWVVQPNARGQVSVSKRFGLGITLTGPDQWTEIISSDVVVGPSCAVKALVYVPLATDGQVANWPAWWTTGPNWPQDGEIDIFEGIRGSLTLSTHYGVWDPATQYASISQQAPVAPPHTGGWITVGMWRENGVVHAYYGTLDTGPVPIPPTADHKLIFQNQSYNSQYANNFGPLLVPSTTWLSRVQVWAP